MTTLQALDVSEARATDRRAMAVTLARAFQDDPLLLFAMRDPVRRARALMRIMISELAHGGQRGKVWAARRDERLLGAAVWFEPGTYRRGPVSGAVNMIRLTPNAAATGARSLQMAKLFHLAETAHPAEEHWYLRILAVDPLCQRSGLGRALLEPGLGRCDAGGLPAYLETQNHENLAWYRRFGFDLVQELRIEKCPPIWTMRREPR
jgi:ribosomal protein S18 acetylase RimI-like enzyme